MEKIENKYVTVSYELFTKDEEGKMWIFQC